MRKSPRRVSRKGFCPQIQRSDVLGQELLNGLGSGGLIVALHLHGHGVALLDTHAHQSHQFAHREVTAPYSMGTSENDKPMKVRFYSGTGGLPRRTGTAISVRCPMVKFRTVKPDRKAASSDFHSLVRYVIEELRYVYAGVLADTGITMEVVEISDGVEKHHVLTPLLPAWEDGTVTDYGDVPCDLGGGPLTIRCKYGNILPTKANAVYYKCNMSSSGVELRINGRAIEHGLFDRVWGEAVHPSQNRFLVQVDLITDNSAALPATKNTKTSFCEADPRLKNLLSWIASYVPAPAKDVDTLEARYIRELTAKRESDPNALRVSRSLRDTAYRAMQSREELEKQLGREPTVDEIAQKTGLSRREVSAAESVVEPLSLEEPVYADGGDAVYVIDQVRDPDGEDSWISGLQFRQTVAGLTPREKRIMELRYLKGKTQMEVAREIGISQAQVSRLEKAALEQFHQMT